MKDPLGAAKPQEGIDYDLEFAREIGSRAESSDQKRVTSETLSLNQAAVALEQSDAAKSERDQWLATEFPAWSNCVPRRMGCTPALALSLDLWGAVVAYRAGTKAIPRWSSMGRKHPTDRGERNHVGLVAASKHGRLLDLGWVIATDWQASIEGETGLPRTVVPSPWAQDLRRLVEEEAPGKGSATRGALAHAGDVSSVNLAYLTVTQLMTQGTWYWRASVRLQQCLAWCFAVPHLGLGEMDSASWLWRSDGASATPERADQLARDLQLWANKSNRRMGSMR